MSSSCLPWMMSVGDVQEAISASLSNLSRGGEKKSRARYKEKMGIVGEARKGAWQEMTRGNRICKNEPGTWGDRVSFDLYLSMMMLATAPTKSFARVLIERYGLCIFRVWGVKVAACALRSSLSHDRAV
jgi:hypothetical protein